MEHAIEQFIQQTPSWGLALIIIVTLAAVGKGADILVDEAVLISKSWGIPTSVIGATIVSLGTTMPEAAISVLAAVEGSPDLALGNAVGSIICDTGLILGIATLITPLKLDRKVVNRQGWLQTGAGILLVLACVPWSDPMRVFHGGVGTLPQWMGFVFLALLALYIIQSMKWSKGAAHEVSDAPSGSTGKAMAKLFGGIVIVIVSSWLLIPAVSEAATRMNVPASIIAATMVAFGTSLPELVTAVTAARKGHGELALGNVIGADILNVLFVAGAAAAVTPAGLRASSHFFTVLFPAMLFVLIVLRLGIRFSKNELKRPFGFVLLAAYLLASLLSYLRPG